MVARSPTAVVERAAGGGGMTIETLEAKFFDWVRLNNVAGHPAEELGAATFTLGVRLAMLHPERTDALDWCLPR